MPENFRKFSKSFLRKLRQIHYFSIFFKRFNKPYVTFRAFARKHKFIGNFEKLLKILDKNSIGKLNFLLKIEPSEIPSFFYNNYSHF